MANINFDLLVTIEDWAGALQQLLDDAKAAIQANDQQARLDAQRALRKFTELSPVEAESLDDIALEAINDLFESVAATALANIAARNAELQKAIESMKDVTSQAEKTTKSLQFEKVISAMDKAKSAAEALKALETALAQPDQTLLRRIKDVTDAIDALTRLAA
jgi:hypothetical protein